jgi:hypothetical protein
MKTGCGKPPGDAGELNRPPYLNDLVSRKRVSMRKIHDVLRLHFD